MKYRIIDVVTSEEHYLPNGWLKGTRYDAMYEVEYWSWRKFKIVSDIKHTYKRPTGARFRDSITGALIDNVVEELLWAYISVRGL